MARGGRLGLLHGLPVAHKDLAETAGVRTTYGSPLFAANVPHRDALVVAADGAGGRDQPGQDQRARVRRRLAHRQPGLRRDPQPLRPRPQRRRQQRRRRGGAGRPADRLADGSDLGGSLRNPASFCNVVGLRPSPGRVPGWPLADVADQFGVSGPMGRTVADTALLLAVLAGPDPRVPLALDQPPPAITDPAQIPALLDRDLRGLRIAWSPDLGLPVEPDVLEVLAPARQVLAGLGWPGHRRGARPVRRGRGVPHVPRVRVRHVPRASC